jgi:hypothetical protein
MTKSKMAIRNLKKVPFLKDTDRLLHLVKLGERNAAPRLLNVHEESLTISPALKSMQGRLIIWRRSHDIL